MTYKALKISGLILGSAFLFLFPYGLAKAYYYVDTGADAPNFSTSDYQSSSYSSQAIVIHPDSNIEIQTAEIYLAKDSATTTQEFYIEIWRNNSTFYGKTNNYNTADLPSTDDVNHDAPHNDYSYFEFPNPIQLDGGYDYYIAITTTNGSELEALWYHNGTDLPNFNMTAYHRWINGNSPPDSPYSSPSGDTQFIKLGDSNEIRGPEVTTIDQPVSGAYFGKRPGDHFTLSGKCPTAGANRLGYKYDLWTVAQKADTANYTLTCDSNQTYSFTVTVPNRTDMTLEVCDYAESQTPGPGNCASRYIYIGPEWWTGDFYDLTLEMPPHNNTTPIYINNQPNDEFTFRLSAQIPDAASTTQVFLSMGEYPDDTFTGTQREQFINLAWSDSFASTTNHFLWYPDAVVSATTTKYYDFILTGDDGLVKNQIKLVANGQGSSTSYNGNLAEAAAGTGGTSIEPGGCDTWDFACHIVAALKYLFIPQDDSMLTTFTDYNTSLSTKPPFGYFTASYNILNGVASTTSSTAQAINLIQTTSTIQAIVFEPLANILDYLYYAITAISCFMIIKKVNF